LLRGRWGPIAAFRQTTCRFRGSDPYVTCVLTQRGLGPARRVPREDLL